MMIIASYEQTHTALLASKPKDYELAMNAQHWHWRPPIPILAYEFHKFFLSASQTFTLQRNDRKTTTEKSFSCFMRRTDHHNRISIFKIKR